MRKRRENMAVQNDPDLESLFREELTERAASLSAGATAIIEGTITPELAGRMVREGHTIKGTGRVMGHEVIARGGEACEVIWRWIQHGEFHASGMVGRVLAILANSLVEALTGSVDDVNGSIASLRTLITDPDRRAELP
jgi:chemotaxis protein histidine kinase CheA